MKLYIDTNIYLSYIHPMSDFKSLEKLKKLINEGKIELVLPSQTKGEFLKHFKERVSHTKNKIKKTETQFQIPNELKGEKKKNYTKEEDGIIKKIDALNDDLKKYRLIKITEFNKHVEHVENLLYEIFDLATFIEYTDEIILRAVIRFAKDLPPKKDNFKFGDAIIWETLKEHIKREDIVIVSIDNDFNDKSKKGVVTINKKLKLEWKKFTNKKVTLYSVLGQFINTIQKEDSISPETIKNESRQASDLYEIVNNDHGLFNLSSERISTGYGRHGLHIGSAAGMIYQPNIHLDTEGYTRYAEPIGTTNLFTGCNAVNSQLRIISPENINSFSDGLSRYSNSVCNKCGKFYPLSLTTININGVCNDCSVLNSGSWAGTIQ